MDTIRGLHLIDNWMIEEDKKKTRLDVENSEPGMKNIKIMTKCREME